MRSGHTSKELWALDMTTSLWERVETKKGICLPERGSSFTPSLCGPIHSMGHTATVQSNRMIVIFGHSPKYGYLNTVQEYHFGSKEWSVVRTSGYPGMVTNDFFLRPYWGYCFFFFPSSTSLLSISYPWLAFSADTAPFKSPQPCPVHLQNKKIQGVPRSQGTVQKTLHKLWLYVCKKNPAFFNPPWLWKPTQLSWWPELMLHS